MSTPPPPPGSTPPTSPPGLGSSAVPDLGSIRHRLARHAPKIRESGQAWQAATAAVFAPGPSGPELAFIRRATRRGDRFSGDMALPGGVRDDSDPDLATTAIRETFEEVGLRLPDPVGRLDDQHERARRRLIATFTFVIEQRTPLRPDPHEVAEALWIPLVHLADPAAASTTRWAGLPFPAVVYEGRVIWGLTHGILTQLGVVVGVPIATERDGRRDGDQATGRPTKRLRARGSRRAAAQDPRRRPTP